MAFDVHHAKFYHHFNNWENIILISSGQYHTFILLYGYYQGLFVISSLVIITLQSLLCVPGCCRDTEFTYKF